MIDNISRQPAPILNHQVGNTIKIYTTYPFDNEIYIPYSEFMTVADLFE